MTREPALAASEGRMPRAQPPSSERRAGCPERTSGDGAWAAPNRREIHWAGVGEARINAARMRSMSASRAAESDVCQKGFSGDGGCG